MDEEDEEWEEEGESRRGRERGVHKSERVGSIPGPSMNFEVSHELRYATDVSFSPSAFPSRFFRQRHLRD